MVFERMVGMKVILNGSEVHYNACVALMDDEIRERLHFEMVPCSAQEFLDAYCKEHEEKFGEDFQI